MDTFVYRWILRIKFYWQVSIDFRLLASLKENDCEVAEMNSPDSLKSYRVRDVLPSFKPSFVSLISVFVCGILWLKNESTNDRMIALENRMNMFPLEVRVESGSPKKYVQPLNVKPTTDSVELLIKKIQTPFTSRIDYTAGRNRGCHFAV